MKIYSSIHISNKMRVAIPIVMLTMIVWGIMPLNSVKKINIQKEKNYATENFIKKWFINDNGTLATYLKDGELVDEDLVKGREALAESLGLWMEFTYLNNQRGAFDDSYQLLHALFLETDGFIHWKLTENGESEVFANALVDDLRIYDVLMRASEKWHHEEYKKTAQIIGRYINKHNLNNGTLTDYYIKNEDIASQVVTLSYIEPTALTTLSNEKVIDDSVYTQMMQLLTEAPFDGPFLPKAFHVFENQYQFDETINLVDQSLVVYYRAKMNVPSTPFKQFIQQEFEKHGKIFGQYNLKSQRPTVNYESPAIYGWLILYALEEGDEQFAQQLYNRMIQFKSTQKKYYGGYSVYNDDTHIFDNLVPLLAESAILLYNKSE